jgi:hypothetical protein
MSLELDGWSAEPPRSGARFEEVVDEETMSAYEDLIASYWELPAESQTLVADLNRFWGPLIGGSQSSTDSRSGRRYSPSPGRRASLPSTA